MVRAPHMTLSMHKGKGPKPVEQERSEREEEQGKVLIQDYSL